MKPKFTAKYDDSPALTSKQKNLPDVVQKAINKKKLRALADKEKSAFLVTGLTGALAGDKSRIKGAIGGVGGGVVGGIAALPFSALAIASAIRRNPKAFAIIKKHLRAGTERSPEATRAFNVLRRDRFGRTARAQMAVGTIGGAYLGGKALGGKKEKKASAFSSYMDKVASHAVVDHSYLQGMNDDYHMLCKSLESLMAQAEHLKSKLNEGLLLPSWAEYKIYKAFDAINSAVSASFPGEYLKVDRS
jgi:hypothetical protein